MEKQALELPANTVTVGRERAVRMAVGVTQGAPAPLVYAAAPRVSALPVYSAYLSYDWRIDQPLAHKPADKAA